MARQGPYISHLFFVDDAKVFFKATNASCGNVLSILRCFVVSQVNGSIFRNRLGNSDQICQGDIYVGFENTEGDPVSAAIRGFKLTFLAISALISISLLIKLLIYSLLGMVSPCRGNIR